MATGTPSDVKTAELDVSIDLPAPEGWQKKFTPKKSATPGKGEVVFIAPDGEEIKNKTQLRNYLKSHAPKLTAKDFDWSTGDTPRRSSRLSGKSKASESPENETPEKKQKKSSSKKATKEEGNGNEDEATQGGKEAPEASNVDAQDTVEDVDKDVVSEKDAGEDPVKGGDVGEPAAEGEKAAPEEQKTDAMELEVTGEEHKSDAVKEQEAATADAEEEKSAAVEEELQDAVAVEEQKESEDVKEQVAGADEKNTDVIEEAVDMDVLLDTDDNEATYAVNEDVQLEIGDGVTDKKKEGDQVSDNSKQSNGGGEEKGVENASVPSQVSEQGPNDFLESLPADFLTNPFTQPATQVMTHPTKAEETADPVGGGEAHKESLSKDEAGNQKTVAASDDDSGMQKSNTEEKQEDP